MGGLGPASRGLPLGPGERMEWEVRFLGVRAGFAWAEVAEEDGAFLLRAGVRSAPWYERVYRIDDRVESRWHPETGSARYRTRFREGGFHQDQDFRFGPDRILLSRRQRVGGAWVDSEQSFPGSGRPLDDPQAAVHRIRLADLRRGGLLEFWNGRGLKALELRPGRPRRLRTVLGRLPAVPVRLLLDGGRRRGLVELVIHLSDDQRRVPLRVELRTPVGAFRAELTSYRPPSGASGAQT